MSAVVVLCCDACPTVARTAPGYTVWTDRAAELGWYVGCDWLLCPACASDLVVDFDRPRRGVVRPNVPTETQRP